MADTDCFLENIRLIITYYEAYLVNADGTRNELVLVGPPKSAYPAKPLEYYCTLHKCSFKQWRAVLSHLGGTAE